MLSHITSIIIYHITGLYWFYYCYNIIYHYLSWSIIIYHYYHLSIISHQLRHFIHPGLVTDLKPSPPPSVVPPRTVSNVPRSFADAPSDSWAPSWLRGKRWDAVNTELTLGLEICGIDKLWGIPSGKHTENNGKSPFLMGKLTISMAIFNSYVKLPEGIYSLLFMMEKYGDNNLVRILWNHYFQTKPMTGFFSERGIFTFLRVWIIRFNFRWFLRNCWNMLKYVEGEVDRNPTLLVIMASFNTLDSWS